MQLCQAEYTFCLFHLCTLNTTTCPIPIIVVWKEIDRNDIHGQKVLVGN